MHVTIMNDIKLSGRRLLFPHILIRFLKSEKTPEDMKNVRLISGLAVSFQAAYMR
jgi:hypothetical protein